MSRAKVNYLEQWREGNPGSPLNEKQANFLKKVGDISNGRKLAVDSNRIQDSHITSLDQFDDWFESLEEAIENEEDQRYLKLTGHLAECTAFLSSIDAILKNLDDLQKLYEFGSQKTNSLHEACESLLQQQHGLIVAVETINEKIAYFTELENMTKKFATPTPLILNESLVPTLTRLDECIAFMESKPNYKESETYSSQLRFCQSQALQTIRTHVINSIQSTTKDVMPESGETLSPGDSVFTLFYGKFQSNAHRIKSLVALIEERVERQEGYLQYLSDCHASFFAARETLIAPVLSVAIEDMVSSHARNFCSLMRNSSRMLMHICRDEYQLFFQFFTKPDHALNIFIESLCLRLYNVLRPIIIHINHFETLSELCMIIQNEVIDDFVANHSEELESFGLVMEQLLQDIQERLVYRSNLYIQTNISGYNPAPGDLAYPEKLEMMENIAECLMSSSSTLSRSNSVASMASTALSDISLISSDRNWDVRIGPTSSSPADIHGMWYPTVRRTILCLTKLYRSLDKPTFQGLSQEVVAACLLSLEEGARQITQRKSNLDGSLFLIKHLLIVREQIAPFHIECTFREVNLDFNRMKTAAFDLIQKRDNLFSLNTNNGLLRFLFEMPGATSVVEEVFDPQKIVDAKIKGVCEHFIQAASEHLASPLLRFLSLVKAVERMKNPIRNQTFAAPDNIRDSVKEMLDQLKNNLPLLRRSMSLYLANHDTETILFRPIKNKLLQHYDQLINLIATNYSAEEKSIIACPPWKDIEMIVSL